jgi:hypothetical protein
MKTLSTWTIATAAALLLSIFAVPERAYAQQPCVSAFPTGPFTMYVTESVQLTVPPGIGTFNQSWQGSGQAVMPPLVNSNGYLTSQSSIVTGTGSILQTGDYPISAVGPFTSDPAANTISIAINASNCEWTVTMYFEIFGSGTTGVYPNNTPIQGTFEFLPADAVPYFPCFDQAVSFSGKTSGQTSCAVSPGLGYATGSSYSLSWSLSPPQCGVVTRAGAPPPTPGVQVIGTVNYFTSPLLGVANPHTQMIANFNTIPGTLTAAAGACGYSAFDWVQMITTLPQPVPYSAVSGTPLRTPPPFNDPPPGGYTYAPAYDPYPFYYYFPLSNELNCFESYNNGRSCGVLPVNSADTILGFFDAPSDPCLPGGNFLKQIIYCGGKTAPLGSVVAFKTALVGVLPDNTPGPDLFSWTWIDTFNGTSGLIARTSNSLPVDPGSGTGGITITGENGVPVLPEPPSRTACNGIYSGTFKGNIRVSSGQTCTFVSGGITGDVQVTGGSLVLSNAFVDGNVQVNDDGTFAIGPSAIIYGNLQIQNTQVGTAQNQVCGSTVKGNLEVQDNGTAVEIGSTSLSSCAGNVIDGKLQVQFNIGATVIDGNTVGGNLQADINIGSTVIDGNTVGDNLQVDANFGSTQVFSNIVSNNLQCEIDASITGGGNTAKRKQGQCSRF